jgi:hypothetical protein
MMHIMMKNDDYDKVPHQGSASFGGRFMDVRRLSVRHEPMELQGQSVHE